MDDQHWQTDELPHKDFILVVSCFSFPITIAICIPFRVNSSSDSNSSLNDLSSDAKFKLRALSNSCETTDVFVFQLSLNTLTAASVTFFTILVMPMSLFFRTNNSSDVRPRWDFLHNDRFRRRNRIFLLQYHHKAIYLFFCFKTKSTPQNGLLFFSSFCVHLFLPSYIWCKNTIRLLRFSSNKCKNSILIVFNIMFK